MNAPAMTTTCHDCHLRTELDRLMASGRRLHLNCFLRTILLLRKMTGQACAEQLRMDPSDLSRMSSGKHSISVATLMRIAQYLGVGPALLVTEVISDTEAATQAAARAPSLILHPVESTNSNP